MEPPKALVVIVNDLATIISRQVAGSYQTHPYSLRDRIFTRVEVAGRPGDYDRHAQFDETLEPGEHLELSIAVRAPRRAGRYELKLDMVDEQVTWFEEQGSSPLVGTLLVLERPSEADAPRYVENLAARGFVSEAPSSFERNGAPRLRGRGLSEILPAPNVLLGLERLVEKVKDVRSQGQPGSAQLKLALDPDIDRHVEGVALAAPEKGHNAVTVWPSDTVGVERLACYLLRLPVSLERFASLRPSTTFTTNPSRKAYRATRRRGGVMWRRMVERCEKTGLAIESSQPLTLRGENLLSALMTKGN